MAPKYRVVLEWDDLLQVRIAADQATPVPLIRLACLVVAESLLLDELARRVVKQQQEGVVLARRVPGNSG